MIRTKHLAGTVGTILVLAVGFGAPSSTARAAEAGETSDDAAVEYSHLELGVGGGGGNMDASGRATLRFRWLQRYTLSTSLLLIGSPFGAAGDPGYLGSTLSVGMWTGNERMQVGLDLGVSAGYRQRLAIIEPNRRTGDAHFAGLVDPRVRWRVVPGLAIGVNVPVLPTIDEFGLTADSAVLLNFSFGRPLVPRGEKSQP